MTQTNPRIELPEYTPEEREELRRHRLEVLKRVRELHERILTRRGGVPVEVDDILDEMRGRTAGDD
jgi:hypothetical protein